MVTDLCGCGSQAVVLVRCLQSFLMLPYIRDASYGEEFKDVGDGQTSLSRGVFEWLVSIQPSHLVYTKGDTCYLEPYVPIQFACQFGYDQLYVGNPNTSLAFMGSLIDGARAWRFTSLVVPRRDCACR